MKLSINLGLSKDNIVSKRKNWKRNPFTSGKTKKFVYLGLGSGLGEEILPEIFLWIRSLIYTTCMNWENLKL